MRQVCSCIGQAVDVNACLRSPKKTRGSCCCSAVKRQPCTRTMNRMLASQLIGVATLFIYHLHACQSIDQVQQTFYGSPSACPVLGFLHPMSSPAICKSSLTWTTHWPMGAAMVCSVNNESFA